MSVLPLHSWQLNFLSLDLTLMFDGKTHFEDNRDYFFPFSQKFLCHFTPQYCRCSGAPFSIANGGAVLSPLGPLVPGVGNAPPNESKPAAKGMVKNALTMSVVAPLFCIGPQFILKFQDVCHSRTQWWCAFIQTMISLLSVSTLLIMLLKSEQVLLTAPWISS